MYMTVCPTNGGYTQTFANFVIHDHFVLSDCYTCIMIVLDGVFG